MRPRVGCAIARSAPTIALRAVIPLAAGLLLAPVPVAGQDDGLSPEVRDRIDAVFATMDDSRSPGCAVGVVNGGDLVFGRAYGMANLEHGIALDTRSVFRMGSVGKQFTATTVVLLSLDGLVDLDEDIRTYLPELPDFGTTVTVRHLLNHTSGYRDYLVLVDLAGKRRDDFYDDRELMEILSAQEELNFQPGEEFLYSNSGYFLLSQLVLRVTGKSLAQVAQERIFEPLDMDETHYHAAWQRVVRRRATGYAPSERYRPPQGEDPYPGADWVISTTTLPMLGDGGVFSSVEDMVPWVANLMNPADLGGPRWRDAMTTRGVLNSGDTLTYALGLAVRNHRGLATVGHGGAFVGYRAAVLTYPGEAYGTVVLCNRADVNPMALAQGVGAAVLQARMEPAPEPTDPSTPGAEEAVTPPPGIHLTTAEMQSYLGEYQSQELGTVYAIEVREQGLWLTTGNHLDGPLEPVALDRMRRGDITLRFDLEHGSATGFRVDAGRVKNLRFVRR